MEAKNGVARLFRCFVNSNDDINSWFSFTLHALACLAEHLDDFLFCCVCPLQMKALFAEFKSSEPRNIFLQILTY